MKRKSFGVFAVFGVFLLLAVVASVSTFSKAESPSVSSVFTGAVQVDKAGYFEVNDMARIEIDKYVGRSGEDLLVDVTNKLPYVGDTEFTFAVQVDDLNLVSFATGTAGMVSRDVFNYTTTVVYYKNGTSELVTERVNESSILVPGTVWSDVDHRIFEWDGRTWAGTEAVLDADEELPFKVVLKIKNFGGDFSEYVKYSYLMNASDVYVEFDPLLGEDGLDLVPQWTELTASTTVSVMAPYTLNASSILTGNRLGAIMDKNPAGVSGYFWLSNAIPRGWLAFDQGPGNSSILTNFSIIVTETNRAPKDYTLQASNDGWVTWTNLSQHNGITNWTNGANKTHIIDNDQAYRHYRLNISGSNDGTYIHVQEWYLIGLMELPDSGSANETEGDDAIEAAINSSVPSATQYKSQQLYVVNATNSQWKGTVDYLVVQNSPQRRWLLNYVTTGESYLNAQNLSGTVYVLEIANKTIAQITDEVSTLINATK